MLQAIRTRHPSPNTQDGNIANVNVYVNVNMFYLHKYRLNLTGDGVDLEFSFMAIIVFNLMNDHCTMNTQAIGKMTSNKYPLIVLVNGDTNKKYIYC
jgi:hypothetical protein